MKAYNQTRARSPLKTLQRQAPHRDLIAACLLGAALAGGLLIFAGCDDGGGGSGSTGGSTIQGNVVSPATKGVVVGVVGTDVQAITDNSGFFVMSGVPTGSQQMHFDYNGSVSTLAVNVPSNGTLYVNDVQWSGPYATCGYMGDRMNPHMNPGWY